MAARFGAGQLCALGTTDVVLADPSRGLLLCAAAEKPGGSVDWRGVSNAGARAWAVSVCANMELENDIAHITAVAVKRKTLCELAIMTFPLTGEVTDKTPITTS